VSLEPAPPGAPIAVVAPASPAPPARYEAGLAWLRRHYELIRTAPMHPRGRPDLAYLAADDASRAAALNEALEDDRVRAIFCARGGYGCARILPALDAAQLRRRRVPIVGFSDITALHAWAAAHAVPSIHGPVVTQLPELPVEDQRALVDLLRGAPPDPLVGLTPIVGGTAEGVLLGGNLTVLAHLCGTPYLPSAPSLILVLEDIGEMPYRVDRALTQLEHAGLLARATGVVLGDFVDCDGLQGHPPRPVTALQVLADRLQRLNVPLVCRAPIGHGARNHPLPLGVAARLDADAGCLEVASPFVSCFSS